MKFDSTFMKIAQADINAGKIPMLLGEPGIGKSSWVINLGKLMHTKVFVLACNQLADKADLTGARLVPITLEDGTQTYKQMFYPHSVIHDAIEYAKNNPTENPILFMDELNRTTPDVTSECLSIPTNRTIGDAELPDNLRVVVAGNDKGNVTALDQASISRFVPYHCEPDLDTYFSVNPELNVHVKETLSQHPETLFCKESDNFGVSTEEDENEDVRLDEILEDDSDAMTQITTPRTITAMSEWLNAFTNDELQQMIIEQVKIEGEDRSVLSECIIAHVGNTPFATYLAATITDNIMSGNADTDTSALSVPKPSVYDQLKTFTDRTELSNFVSEMSDRDKSGCLVYALYEKEDNRHIIEAIAEQLNTALEDDDRKTLMTIAANGKNDEQNTNYFLELDLPITQTLNVILS